MKKTQKIMLAAALICMLALINAMSCLAQEDIVPADTTSIRQNSVTDEQEQKTEAIPFMLVETKPSFDGGDGNKFIKWVNSQLQYPETLKDSDITGRVVVKFIISEEGKVTDVTVAKGVHEELDQEALRVVSMSPDWTPGRQEDKPVPVMYSVPVVFQIR